MTKKRIISIVLIGVLLATLLVGTLVTVFLLQSVASSEEKYVAEDGAGNKFESGKVYELPSNLLFLANSAVGDSVSIELKVTLIPSYATNKNLSWGLKWVDENSNWAHGKNVDEYVLLTENSESMTATVECKKAFSEQLKLTVSSNENSEIKAECLFDYQSRFIGIKGFPTNEIIDLGLVPISSSDTRTLKEIYLSMLEFEFSDGTLPAKIRENGLPEDLTFDPVARFGTVSGDDSSLINVFSMSGLNFRDFFNLLSAPNNSATKSVKDSCEQYLFNESAPNVLSRFIAYQNENMNNKNRLLQFTPNSIFSNVATGRGFNMPSFSFYFTDLERSIEEIRLSDTSLEFSNVSE